MPSKKILLCLFISFLLSSFLFSQNQSDTDFTNKLSPLLSLDTKKNNINIQVKVSDIKAFKQWLSQNLPKNTITKEFAENNIIKLTQVSAKNLQKLIQCPWLIFMDADNRKPKEEREIGNLDLSANQITKLHQLFPELKGEGRVISVKEKPFDTTDIDLRGRILLSPQFDEAATFHATAMASIIAGAGNSSSKAKGVAEKSRLSSADFENLLPDNGQQLLALGISVQNHSYGVGIENFYGLEAQEYDRHCKNYPSILHIFSSGNVGNQASAMGTYKNIAGFANLTGQFKMSKNTLSVGASDSLGRVVALSSRGPTYDGRIKPELLAFGDGGSSESAALVSGTALLMQEAYQKQFNQLPPASLLKAALINSADDVANPEVDFESGFGNLDAYGAVQSILENRFYIDSLQQGKNRIFQINVPADISKLKITLVWQDREAQANAPKALVNDLDLELHQIASGEQWKPWVLNSFPHPDSLKLPAKRGIDRLNNVEQITLELPESGLYELIVWGFNIPSGKQSFSLVYEFEQGFEWINPVKGINLKAGENNPIRWEDNNLSPFPARLEYKLTETDDWILIDENIDLSDNYFNWTAPDTIALAQLRFITDTESIISDTFNISRPLRLQLGFNCSEKVMLYWNPQPEADSYRVFALGGKFFEPLTTTQDTLLVLNKSGLSSSYFIINPITESKAGIQSNTLNYLNQGIDCYIKTFLSREYVTDTVSLDLELVTLYQLKFVSLERANKGGFQTIQTISPVNNLNLNLEDKEANPGLNTYRIKVVNENNEVFYSRTEAVYFAKPNNLFLYPNPIVKGEPLQVIFAGEEIVTVQWYNSLGKFIRGENADGTTKEYATKGLASGLYLVQFSSEKGILASGRIIIL